MILHKSSDTIIQWDGLKSCRTGNYVNAAVMTFTIKDMAGNALAGASGIVMSYIATSDGKYQGTLQSTVALGDPGTQYFCEITATSAGDVAFRRIRCVVQYKGPT